MGKKGKIILIFVIGALALAGAFYAINKLQSGAGNSAHASGQLYHCPMHPTYISDKPGDCPICMMKLVPIKDDLEDDKPRKGKYYCPMDPGQESDTPGVCKKCNMNLIPAPEPAPEHTSVKITPERQQLIGVRTEKAAVRRLVKTIHAAGIVTKNETATTHIYTRFPGWVEETSKTALAGTFVEKGALLFSIYSPELVTAQTDYLIALETLKKARTAGIERSIRDAEELVKSTKQKLYLWNISDDQVTEIGERGVPSKALWITAPHAGFIIGKDLNPGDYIEAGKSVYMVSDMSKVWVNAQIYEREVDSIMEGDSVTVKLLSQPSVEIEGKVLFIYPNLQETTRTATVRIELANADYKAKLNMYCTVDFKINIGEKLSIPTEAVMDTGTRKIVFVRKGAGTFEPRQVKVGRRAGDYYEIMEGISEGEEVVSSGNFLIDSESRLKASLKQMTSHKH